MRRVPQVVAGAVECCDGLLRLPRCRSEMQTHAFGERFQYAALRVFDNAIVQYGDEATVVVSGEHCCRWVHRAQRVWSATNPGIGGVFCADLIFEVPGAPSYGIRCRRDAECTGSRGIRRGCFRDHIVRVVVKRTVRAVSEPTLSQFHML